MSANIILATTDEEINACYAVMAELRPQVTQDEFLGRVKRQTAIADYRLACVIDGGLKPLRVFRKSRVGQIHVCRRSCIQE
jgi:hypothetical protein